MHHLQPEHMQAQYDTETAAPGWVLVCRSPILGAYPRADSRVQSFKRPLLHKVVSSALIPVSALPSDVVWLIAVRSGGVRPSPCRLRPTYEDVWRAIRRNFVTEAPERTLQVPDVWIVGNATDVMQADSKDSCEVRRIYILMTARPEDCLRLHGSSASFGCCCCQH